MKTVFVLDTNVLLHDPDAIFAFEEHDVVIPIYVIEELDRFKREQNELGRAARKCSRTLDRLQEDGELLHEGIELGDNLGILYVTYTDLQSVSWAIGSNDVDTRIIACALDLKKDTPDDMVILVTKDTNLRIRAGALGLIAEDYIHDKIEISELYTGIVGAAVTTEEIEMFERFGHLVIDADCYSANEFIQLRNLENPSQSALGRYSAELQQIVSLKRAKNGLWGIRPRNKEQAFAIDLLLDDSIKLVTLVGKAGTGKTLTAIAAGLQKVTDERIYQRVLVSRPVMPMGKDIGFLPGDISEKLNPWMQPIFDNVEFLMGLGKDEKRRGRSYEELIDLGLLQIEPLTYIRGRSIPGQFMLVDEAQNLSRHEVFTILTRAGEGTKIVLTGDPYQIDNPYLDATNNGLVHVVNAFKNETIAGHVTLTQGERSELAERAANLL